MELARKLAITYSCGMKTEVRIYLWPTRSWLKFSELCSLHNVSQSKRFGDVANLRCSSRHPGEDPFDHHPRQQNTH